MARNLFTEYINYTKKSIRKYLRIIMKNSYDEEISNAYIDEYVNVRYYNLKNESKQRVFYLNIRENLEKLRDKLLNKNEKTKYDDIVKYKEKEQIIKNFCEVFDYILFFDNVRSVDRMKSIEDMSELLDNLYKERQEKYLINERVSTKDELMELIKNDMISKDLFLDKCFSDEFELTFNRMNCKNNIYWVGIKSNINMPMIYSEYAINKAFNSAIVKEDRLFVEYTLLSVIIIGDIIDANFKEQYIVEFMPSLLEKDKKLKNLLKIFDDPALQDKVNFNVMYEDFIDNKDDVFDLLKQGYKFSITLDNSLKNAEEIDKLSMFSYIIIDKNLNCYKEIKSKYKEANIIEKGE